MSTLTGYLTRSGADLSNVCLNATSIPQNVNIGRVSGSTAYTIQFGYPLFPGQVICYTNGPTYSGMIIGNIYWGYHSNNIITVSNIGNAFSPLVCFYGLVNGTRGEYITITMNANVTQEITYIFKQM
jgi:hypothetical protein